jgi:hypothetical protein
LLYQHQHMPFKDDWAASRMCFISEADIKTQSV